MFCQVQTGKWKDYFRAILLKLEAVSSYCQHLITRAEFDSDRFQFQWFLHGFLSPNAAPFFKAGRNKTEINLRYWRWISSMISGYWIFFNSSIWSSMLLIATSCERMVLFWEKIWVYVYKLLHRDFLL